MLDQSNLTGQTPSVTSLRNINEYGVQVEKRAREALKLYGYLENKDFYEYVIHPQSPRFAFRVDPKLGANATITHLKTEVLFEQTTQPDAAPAKADAAASSAQGKAKAYRVPKYTAKPVTTAVNMLINDGVRQAPDDEQIKGLNASAQALLPPRSSKGQEPDRVHVVIGPDVNKSSATMRSVEDALIGLYRNQIQTMLDDKDSEYGRSGNSLNARLAPGCAVRRYS